MQNRLRYIALMFISTVIDTHREHEQTRDGNGVDIVVASGRFVRLGLEMLALSLAIREPHHVVADMPLIGSVVALLQTFIPYIAVYCSSRQKNSCSSPATPSTRDVQVLMVSTKALYCLECSLERGGYLAAFRESGGVAIVSQLLELFSHGVQLDYSTRCLLVGSADTAFLSNYT